MDNKISFEGLSLEQIAKIYSIIYEDDDEYIPLDEIDKNIFNNKNSKKKKD